MVTAMSEKGVDMAFRRPVSLTERLMDGYPDRVVSLGCPGIDQLFPDRQVALWDVEDPADASLSRMREIRDDVETRVRLFLEGLNT